MFPLFNDRLDIILLFFCIYTFNPHHNTHSYTHTHTAPSTTTTPGGARERLEGSTDDEYENRITRKFLVP